LGFLIDSSVIIRYEREARSPEAVVAHFSDVPSALSAITASEIIHGIHRAQDERIREQRQKFVEAILTNLPVLPFTLEIARAHAYLWADLQKRGQMIGERDLMIAATALVHSLTIITGNTREFQRIQDLKIVEW
jgi:tRNA(fMet)-specific endonuclease VapC